MAYRAVDNYVYDEVRHFLRRRHKVQSRGTRSFPATDVFGTLGVLRLRRVHLGPLPCKTPAWTELPDDMR
jgi:RNA-directed DNA polymerase